MNESLLTIDIPRIKASSQVMEKAAIGNDFIIGEVHSENGSKNTPDALHYPIRFDGYILFFLRKGFLSVDVDLKSYDIGPDSLVILVPGNIVKVSMDPEKPNQEIAFSFVLVSKDYMSDIRIDFQKVFRESLRVLDHPCIVLDDFQVSVANDYFALMQKLVGSRLVNKRDVIGSLLTSLSYLSVDVWTRQMDKVRQEGPVQKSARLNQIFEQFIGLVSEYHDTERGVAFYAEKMCLTPKYLSKLIKQASGRSAPDWIDSFVILEAKNMLKYSNMPIKEIVFNLHFPNQSVFYKFFKAHTGQTPSEYRKGN